TNRRPRRPGERSVSHAAGGASVATPPAGCDMPPKAAPPAGRGGGVGGAAPHRAGPQAAPPPRSPQCRRRRLDIDGGSRRGEGSLVPPPRPQRCFSSWYSASTFTDQMSWSAPRMFSTASMAVYIEWSWLLYRCMPLRPTGNTLGVLADSQRRSVSTLALYPPSYIGYALGIRTTYPAPTRARASC